MLTHVGQAINKPVVAPILVKPPLLFVIDIALNVKKIIFGADFSGNKNLTLEKSGPGVVTAGDIFLTEDIKILNPDLVICTLDNDTSFRMELSIKTGNGYVSSEENRKEDDPIGLIPVDSLYSPVRKVTYDVDNAREEIGRAHV